MRALLREVESRCRGLQDQIEESRAREKRVSEAAEDARTRAEAEAGQSLHLIGLFALFTFKLLFFHWGVACGLCIYFIAHDPRVCKCV